jgi:hypothetical protein
LLKAANDVAGAARNAWLAFLGLIAHFFVALAGVLHTDFLFNSGVKWAAAELRKIVRPH